MAHYTENEPRQQLPGQESLALTDDNAERLSDALRLQDIAEELAEYGTEAGGEAVSHPKHYTSHPSGVECIEIAQHMNFCIGNAVKYLWRHGQKDPSATVEDLHKAVWYIRKEIARLEGAA